MSGKRLNVFVSVKGHGFDRNALENMVRACGAEPTIVDQPAASLLMNPSSLRGYDAVLLYDMWGMDFQCRREERPASVSPDPVLVAGWEALLQQGKGIVALHHAIAGWPAWDGYARMLGGRFLYRNDMLCGRERQDSGYAADVPYAVATCGNHPVLSDVPARFELRDELYAMEILEEEEELFPLIVRETDVDPALFQSASNAVRRVSADEAAPWVPPRDNRLLGWVKRAGNSPVVYLQPGDNAATFAGETYRHLVGNALRWVASEDARAWAARTSGV